MPTKARREREARIARGEEERRPRGGPNMVKGMQLHPGNPAKLIPGGGEKGKPWQWKPGESGNPAGFSGPARVAYQEMVEEARASSKAILASWRQIREDKDAPPSARIDAGKAEMAYAWGKPVETTRAEVFDHRDPPVITVRTLPIGRAIAEEPAPPSEDEQKVN